MGHELQLITSKVQEQNQSRSAIALSETIRQYHNRNNKSTTFRRLVTSNFELIMNRDSEITIIFRSCSLHKSQYQFTSLVFT
ncbi:hypothetical protein HanIR_Chr02g0061251 [Helianthus annuus]|nr:hypothetical protein HanIR_Chr02g0061251 [Helianthus annuus]